MKTNAQATHYNRLSVACSLMGVRSYALLAASGIGGNWRFNKIDVPNLPLSVAAIRQLQGISKTLPEVRSWASATVTGRIDAQTERCSGQL